MRGLLIAVFLNIAASTIARPEITITNQVAKEIGHSYGFYLGQVISLEMISSSFPTLAGSVLVAESEFWAAFGDSIEEMDRRMTSLDPTKWEEIKDNTRVQLDETMGRFEFTQTNAVDFIQLVRARAKGDLPTPVYQSFLTFNPRYIRNPAAEFVDGYKQRYESSGSGKAKGVAFSLEVPISWKTMDGNRPNVVTKFVSENGRGLEFFVVLIRAMPNSIGASEVAEMMNRSHLRDVLPEGGEYLSSGRFAVETLPGYWVRYDMSGMRGRQTLDLSVIMYTTFYRDRMIVMQGQVGGQGGGESGTDLHDRFTRCEGLFDLIANSLVLPQVYDP